VRPADIRTLDGAGNIGMEHARALKSLGSPLDFLVSQCRAQVLLKISEDERDRPCDREDREFTLEPAWNYLVSFRQELPDITAWSFDEEELQRFEYKLAEEVYYNRDATGQHLFRDDRCERLTLRLR
jgi:hypothetical protein